MNPKFEIEVLRYIKQAKDLRLYSIEDHFREKHPSFGLTQQALMIMAWDWDIAKVGLLRYERLIFIELASSTNRKRLTLY